MQAGIGNGRGVSVAIVTRGHKQDEECLRAAATSRPDYIGMIGSKRRTNIVLEKLREEGASENELQKVRAPIGLDIGAVSPEEVALAILAEIVRHDRRARVLQAPFAVHEHLPQRGNLHAGGGVAELVDDPSGDRRRPLERDVDLRDDLSRGDINRRAGAEQ